MGREMNNTLIEFFNGWALIVIFFNASYMILSPKVNDGVLLKMTLIALALSCFLGVLTRLKGYGFPELDMAIILSAALVSVTLVLRVLKGTSLLCKDRK